MGPNGKFLRGCCIVAYACYVLYYSFHLPRAVVDPERNLLGQSYSICTIVMITIGYDYCVLVKAR